MKKNSKMKQEGRWQQSNDAWKLNKTRKSNWCQCTTTSFVIISRCWRRESRPVFPSYRMCSFFYFYNDSYWLCHNRNESALQMLKILTEKIQTNKKKNGKFEKHMFDYYFTFFFGHKIDRFLPSSLRYFLFDFQRNKHIFILNALEKTIIIC